MSEEKNFAVGDRVKIIAGAYTMDGAEGSFGTILKPGSFGVWKWIVKVDFPGTQSDELGFNDDELELAPAPAEPTGDGAADVSPYEPNNDLNAHSMEIWTKMFRERLDWKGFYNEHAKSDMMDALDVIATLQAKLAAAQAERDAAIELLKEVERNMPTNEPFAGLPRVNYENSYSAYAVGAAVRVYLRNQKQATGE